MCTPLKYEENIFTQSRNLKRLETTNKVQEEQTIKDKEQLGNKKVNL